MVKTKDWEKIAIEQWKLKMKALQEVEELKAKLESITRVVKGDS